MCGGIFGNERMTTVCSRTTKKQNSCWTMKAFSGQVSRISPKNRNFGWFLSSANEIKPNWSTFCVVPLVIKNWNFAYQTVFISQACRFCRFLYIEKSHNCTSNVIPPSNSWIACLDRLDCFFSIFYILYNFTFQTTLFHIVTREKRKWGRRRSGTCYYFNVLLVSTQNRSNSLEHLHKCPSFEKFRSCNFHFQIKKPN